MLRTFLLAATFTVTVTAGFAQFSIPRPPQFSTENRWAIGFHGGVNLWINDLNTRRASPGGDLFIRYGFAPRLSLGLMMGYDRLISIQYPFDPPQLNTVVENEYIGLKALSADLVLWYHFPPTMEIRPYAFIGIGGMAYTRQDLFDRYLPDGVRKTNTSMHIPVGFGFELPTSRRVSFTIDFSGRILDDYTDDWKGHKKNTLESATPGLVDWYPSVRAGFIFYLGSRDDDDDDGDGLSNSDERRYGTNPNNPDTDGDGLKDGEEIWRYNTDPLRFDTDGDGLRDGEEVRRYSTFPNKPDTDGDGLSDGDEVHVYFTDPLKIDTDGDGLTDTDEVRKYGTNPLKADTDDDGLTDSEELNVTRTDPRNRDTDRGGIDDGIEVRRGTNPLDPSDDIPRKPELKAEIGKAIVLEGIVFRTASAVISPESEQILTLALNTLSQHPEMTVEIHGHTDNTGTRAFNNRLSLQRAESVKRWLVNKGIEEFRIKAVGFGQDYPIDTNRTEEGRQRNRRIEFYRTR